MRKSSARSSSFRANVYFAESCGDMAVLPVEWHFGHGTVKTATAILGDVQAACHKMQFDASELLRRQFLFSRSSANTLDCRSNQDRTPPSVGKFNSISATQTPTTPKASNLPSN